MQSDYELTELSTVCLHQRCTHLPGSDYWLQASTSAEQSNECWFPMLCFPVANWSKQCKYLPLEVSFCIDGTFLLFPAWWWHQIEDPTMFKLFFAECKTVAFNNCFSMGLSCLSICNCSMTCCSLQTYITLKVDSDYQPLGNGADDIIAGFIAALFWMRSYASGL